ncbi:hypothetical protein AB0Q95_06105 [Streptomyces sp. NPDC059900]|uniref:hypothetical protein n=1 Tax=Streptomyces sp. NPDC059900 TaxID=3155816 RepID=UPI0034475D93
MTVPDDELTPWERDFLENPAEPRGYQPRGDAQGPDEPPEPPRGPAGASPPGPDARRTDPDDPASAGA